MVDIMYHTPVDLSAKSKVYDALELFSSFKSRQQKNVLQVLPAGSGLCFL